MPNWGGGNTHGGDSATNETTQEEQPMPDWSGGSAHGGDSATDEAAQEEKPMPSWGGGSTHGGDGTTNEAEDATETVDAAHATTNEETSAPNSD